MIFPKVIQDIIDEYLYKDLWKSHLEFNLADHDELNQNVHENYGCDICGHSVSPDGWYQATYSSNIDFCEKCVNNIKDELKLIDRINFSEKDKPRRWPCLFCNKKMGGGFKWYSSEKLKIDVCLDCYPKSDLKTKTKQISCDENTYLCKRTSPGVIITLKKLDFKTYQIPNELKHEIKLERNQEWIYYFDCLAEVNLERENLLEWTLITDVNDMETYPASTGLIMNCVSENHEIASLVSDDHGRVAINQIYNSYKEYLKELKEWKNKRLTGKELENKIEEIKKIFKDKYECNEHIMKLGSKHFSEYIRLDRELGFYYG